MKVSFVEKPVILCLAAFLWAAAAAPDHGSNYLSPDENEEVDASAAIVEGRVWLDLVRDGIQDDGERGVQDVLVELRTPTKRFVEHATETGPNGEFQFILDELDFVDPLGNGEFYVQLYSPNGYKFSLLSELNDSNFDDCDASTVNGGVMASTPFHVVLGETYKVDAGVVPSCDPSLALISFFGVKSASSLNDGSISIEWDPAELLPYDDNASLDCDDDDILYDVFVAPAPFDYSPYSFSDLIELSKESDDMIHIETDELDAVVTEVSPGDTVSVLVMAKAFDVISDQQEQRDVMVQYSPELELDDEEPFYEFDESVTPPRGNMPGTDLRMHRQEQEVATPLINEVLWLPNPTSPKFSERRMFLEIYRADRYGLGRCRLENDDGSLRIEFGEPFENTYGTYYSIRHKATLKKPFEIWRRKRIIWVRDFPLKEVDSVALFCDDEMVDFVAWGKDGVGPNGPLITIAVEAGMWPSTTAFVETGSLGLNDGLLSLGMQSGNSLGRDAVSTDTNSEKDWTYPGGLNARTPTPSAQNVDESGSALPLLNEIMVQPDPKAKSFRIRRQFFEIYRPDTSFSLSGCSLLNDAGTFNIIFDESFDLVDHRYVTVKRKSTLKRKLRLERSKGILWIRDLVVNENVDGVALECDGAIVDYVAWGKKGNGPSGDLHTTAVASRMWTGLDDFIELAPVDLGGGYTSPGLRQGDSMGRDKDSRDTDSPKDWAFFGGLNARKPTPASTNLQHVHFPVINEVLFWPRRRSRFSNRRRTFIEIYRRDTSYSLSGCTLVNNDGSLRIDFGKSFDSVYNRYLSIKRKRTLKKEFQLWRRSGILWVRDLVLEKIDAIALFCDGRLVDYVTWGNDGDFWKGTLHETAVASGMWSGAEDYVEVVDLKRGDSLGRDAFSRNTRNKIDWSFPGGRDADAATPSARNEPQEPDDSLLRLAVDNFNSFFSPALTIEAADIDGTVTDTRATSFEMMESLALVTATSFDESASLVTMDDLPESVTDEDLEQMRADLESTIAAGDVRVMVTISDKSRDRRIKTLNTMSAGGQSFSGPLLTYTHLPSSFVTPDSERRLQEIIEVQESERTIITSHLWGTPGFIIDADYRCSGPTHVPLRCSISQIMGQPSVFGEIQVLSPVLDTMQPSSLCRGESNYAWAIGFKRVKVAPSRASLEVEGSIGQSSSDTLSIDKWCPASGSPTASPTGAPTQAPTQAPTPTGPTPSPTESPAPSESPTESPAPSESPSESPTPTVTQNCTCDTLDLEQRYSQATNKDDKDGILDEWIATNFRNSRRANYFYETSRIAIKIEVDPTNCRCPAKPGGMEKCEGTKTVKLEVTFYRYVDKKGGVHPENWAVTEGFEPNAGSETVPTPNPPNQTPDGRVKFDLPRTVRVKQTSTTSGKIKRIGPGRYQGTATGSIDCEEGMHYTRFFFLPDTLGAAVEPNLDHDVKKLESINQPAFYLDVKTTLTEEKSCVLKGKISAFLGQYYSGRTYPKRGIGIGDADRELLGKIDYIVSDSTTGSTTDIGETGNLVRLISENGARKDPPFPRKS